MEYMSREDYCELNCGKENRQGYKTCHNCSMLNVPSANVRPVRYGSWSEQVLIDDGFGGKKVGYICLVCKQFVPNKGKFCLECGADMK